MKAEYGTKVKYEKGKELEFPDFDLSYIGTRDVKVPVYGPGHFTYYEFEISSGKERKTVSWSSGTGEIGPVEFNFNGKRYALELMRSYKLGKLEQDELVVFS